MSRGPRLDYPGAWHHVMHRGARRAPIFKSDEHCLLFLDCLDDTVRRFGIEVHAWSLMPNHYHLLVRTPLGNLSRAMRHLNGVYTLRVNRLRAWEGPVFRGRFRSRLVQDERYQRYLVAYIHLNPVRARLVQRPDEDAWTSHRQLVELDTPAPWLSTGARDHLFGTPAQLDEFAQAMHKKRDPWPEDLQLDLQMRGPRQVAPPADETPPPKRAPDVDAILSRVSLLTNASLEVIRRAVFGPNANPARRFAAIVLAREPTLTHTKIGHALAMSPRQVANILYRQRRDGLPADLAAWNGTWLAEEGTRESEQ